RPGRRAARVDLQQHAAVLRRALRAPDSLGVDSRTRDRRWRAHLRRHRVRAGGPAGARARADHRVSSPGHNRDMAEDFMPLLGWDHLELWVGNAKQAAYFYEHAMSCTRTAYAGPETGVRDRASYVLEQGDVRFVVTSALREEH